MKRLDWIVLVLLPLALLGAPRAAQAAQSYENSTGFISTLPAVISTSGTWCMDKNLSTSITSGVSITVNANDVTIDCNEFTMDDLGGGAGTLAYGIYANNRTNITVRRCAVRGYYYGVVLAGGTGHLAEDNHFDANTYVGLRIDGNRSTARRNRVDDTGGSTAVAAALGIVTNASVDVLVNTVTQVTARAGGNGNAYGIFTTANTTASVNGNRVRTILGDGTGVAFGIYHNTSGRLTMRDNDLIGVGGGGLALRCANANASARDNMLLGFAAGINGCSNDGGNVNAP
jgi:hypothetical protein